MLLMSSGLVTMPVTIGTLSHGKNGVRKERHEQTPNLLRRSGSEPYHIILSHLGTRPVIGFHNSWTVG